MFSKRLGKYSASNIRRTYFPSFALSSLYQLKRYIYWHSFSTTNIARRGNTCMHSRPLCSAVVGEWNNRTARLTLVSFLLLTSTSSSSDICSLSSHRCCSVLFYSLLFSPERIDSAQACKTWCALLRRLIRARTQKSRAQQRKTRLWWHYLLRFLLFLLLNVSPTVKHCSRTTLIVVGIDW